MKTSSSIIYLHSPEFTFIGLLGEFMVPVQNLDKCIVTGYVGGYVARTLRMQIFAPLVDGLEGFVDVYVDSSRFNLFKMQCF